ncbi:MAG: hypothetical protein JNL58_14505 [Planctomyces sp.]|nr:hypothetical protein [Planctomyces sp.]
MKRKRYGLSACFVLVVGIAGLVFYSRSNEENITATVIALQKSGVIVSPLTPIPLTGVVNQNRIYVTTQLPFSLCRYSVSIPPGHCTEENLKLVIDLARNGALTNIAFGNDSVTALRCSSIEELLRLSNCSAQLKLDLSDSLREVDIAIFQTTSVSAPLAPNLETQTPNNSEH